VSTLNFPEKLDFILIDGATLLLRARAPPETWTTRLEPFGRLETAVVDHFYWLVIIFSTSCPKYEQPAEWLAFGCPNNSDPRCDRFAKKEQNGTGKCTLVHGGATDRFRAERACARAGRRTPHAVSTPVNPHD
jgi:hypothetical protein